MRYLLDTSVLSEAARRNADPGVVAWLGEQAQIDLAISVLAPGEIERGVRWLDAGRKRERLRPWSDVDPPRRFRDRILPIDADVARAWGRLSAEARDAGRPLPAVDGLPLATAAASDPTFVTRSERDCGGRGVPVLNPWRDG